jgi:hypothetical protein
MDTASCSVRNSDSRGGVTRSGGSAGARGVDFGRGQPESTPTTTPALASGLRLQVEPRFERLHVERLRIVLVRDPPLPLELLEAQRRPSPHIYPFSAAPWPAVRRVTSIAGVSDTSRPRLSLTAYIAGAEAIVRGVRPGRRTFARAGCSRPPAGYRRRASDCTIVPASRAPNHRQESTLRQHGSAPAPP